MSNNIEAFIESQKRIIFHLSLGIDEDDTSQENAALRLQVEQQKRVLYLAKAIQADLRKL